MPGWLTAAANVFRKQAPAPLQTYSVRCSCGRVAAGTRTDSAQLATCPACQSPLFIFPASVYPALRAPPPKPKKNFTVRQAPSEESTARTGDRNRSAGTPVEGRAAREKTARSPATRGRSASQRTTADDPRAPTAEPALPERRRRIFTPLRLVLAGLVLVVTATVWWLFHLQALDRAREAVAAVPRLAEEALQEGDLHEAARQYEQLRAAVDLLGRDDPQSLRWKQLARETAALSDLVAAPLHAILQEAAEASTGKMDSLWNEIFRGTYRGGWVLIDAPVSRADGKSGTAQFNIDYPLAVGTHSARLVADLPAFKSRLVEGTSPQRVIFAAQLADCRKDASGDGDWRIEFRPETGFLWSGAETYQMAGMPADESALAVLAEQSRQLGIEP